MNTKRKPFRSYEIGLSERLTHPRYAAAYLNSVLDNPEAGLAVFLLAVADIARAHGFTDVARRAELHRVGLHKMLRKGGNPEFRSIIKILNSLHLRLSIKPLPILEAA